MDRRKEGCRRKEERKKERNRVKEIKKIKTRSKGEEERGKLKDITGETEAK